jgi:hypothetical protein
MLIVLLMMPLREDAATDIARENGELILIILVIVATTLVILIMMDAACWGEQGEYHSTWWVFAYLLPNAPQEQ